MAAPPPVFQDINVDFSERSLIVHYTLDTPAVDPRTGQTVGKNTEPHKKRIRLKPFTEGTDIRGLAQAIVKQCEIIPRDRLPLVVELLLELQHIDLQQSGGGSIEPAAPPQQQRAIPPRPSTASRGARPPAPAAAPGGFQRGGSAGSGGGGGKESEPEDDVPHGHHHHHHPRHGGAAQQQQQRAGPGRAASPAPAEDSGDDDPAATLDRLDEYIEALYEEDMAAKVTGAQRVLAVAKRAENLRYFYETDSLLGTLARVLRDEWRKSVDLTLALMQIFFCMSHFTQMHPVVVNHRIGDLCMKIVDLEHRRFTARRLDSERLEQLAELQAAGDAAGEQAFRLADADERAREEAAAEAAASEAAKRVAVAAAATDDAPDEDEDLMGDGEGEGKGDDAAGFRRGTSRLATAEAARRIKLKPLPPGKVDIEKERRKARVLTRKQEALMYVCLHLLMNLAEDVAIERKMCKRNIVGLLTPVLDRDNTPLLLLAVTFLKKLSIFEENKNAMMALAVGPKLVALLPDPADVTAHVDPNASHVLLESSVLRLVFNLTFDQDMSAEFIAAGLLPKVGAMLKCPPFRGTAIKVLFHLSQGFDNRPRFADTDALSLVLKLVNAFPQPHLPRELAAIAINLAMHPDTAEAFIRADAVRLLSLRVAKTGDPLVMKLLRCLAQHTYSLQADENLKAAAAEERAWSQVHREHYKEQVNRLAYAKRAESAAAAAAAAEAAEGKADDQEDVPLPVVEMDAATAHAEAVRELGPLRIPAVPDEPIEYDYQFEGAWGVAVREILHALRSNADDPAMAVEALGTLSYLTPRDLHAAFSFTAMSQNPEFMHIVQRYLDPRPGATDDDILLEAVQLVAAMALDPGAAPGLAASSVPRLLADILAEKVGDNDILHQAVAAVLRLLHRPETREAIVANTPTGLRMVELLSHPLPPLAADVDEAVTLIINHDREHGSSGAWRQIMTRRFQLYNREWLEAVGAAAGRLHDEDEEEEGEEEEEESSGGMHTGGRSGYGGGGYAGGTPGRAGGGGNSGGFQVLALHSPAEAGKHPADEDDGQGSGEGSGTGSPVSPGYRHMGRHGENVAMDLSLLADVAAQAGQRAAGGGARPRLSAYASDVAQMGDGEGGEEDLEGFQGLEDGESEVPADVQALMNAYLQRQNVASRLEAEGDDSGGRPAAAAGGRRGEKDSRSGSGGLWNSGNIRFGGWD